MAKSDVDRAVDNYNSLMKKEALNMGTSAKDRKRRQDDLMNPRSAVGHVASNSAIEAEIRRGVDEATDEVLAELSDHLDQYTREQLEAMTDEQLSEVAAACGIEWDGDGKEECVDAVLQFYVDYKDGPSDSGDGDDDAGSAGGGDD